MEDYVLKGKLEVDYDAKRTERKVGQSMQRIEKRLKTAGERMGRRLGRGIELGIGRGLRSLDRSATRTGHAAGEALHSGLKRGLDKVDSRIAVTRKNLRGLGGGLGGGRGGGARSSGGGGGGLMGLLGMTPGGMLARATAGFGAYGALRGIASITTGLIGLNSEIENTEVGLATLFSANFKTPIEQSLKLSKRVMKDLRHDAAVGVGETSDYALTYQQLLTPVLQSGGSLADVRRMTKLSVAAGAASGREGGMELAGLDVLQALSGSASDRTMQVLGGFMKASGTSFEKLNGMSGSDRLDAIAKALETVAPGADVMGQSFSGQAGTLRGLLKEFAVAGSSGLFTKLTGGLRGFNRWLGENSTMITSFVENSGSALVGLWDVGAGFASEIGPYLPGLVADTKAWGEQLRHLGGSIKSASDSMLSKIVVGGIMGWVQAWVDTFRFATLALDFFTIALGHLGQMAGQAAGLIYAGMQGNLTGAMIASAGRTFQGNSRERGRQYGSLVGMGWGKKGWRTRQGNAMRDMNTGANGGLATSMPPMTVNNFNGPIHVEVDTEVNAEPTRVAMAWEEAFGKIARNRTSSRRPGLATG